MAGKIDLVVRYGSKPLEFSRGKSAIELASEVEVANVPDKVRLKTGGLQKAAISLYESLGYYHNQPFGDYLHDPLSLFKQKHLVPSART